MGSVSGKFEDFIDSSISPDDTQNLLEGNTGNVVWSEGQASVYTDFNAPDLPSGPTFYPTVTGVKYTLSWTTTETFEFRTFIYEGESNVGTIQTKTVTPPGASLIIGGTNDLLGLNWTGLTLSDLRVYIGVPFQLGLGDNDTVTLNNPPGLVPTIYYDLNNYNKVTLSSGKVSLYANSGKVSIT